MRFEKPNFEAGPMCSILNMFSALEGTFIDFNITDRGLCRILNALCFDINICYVKSSLITTV